MNELSIRFCGKICVSSCACPSRVSVCLVCVSLLAERNTLAVTGRRRVTRVMILRGLRNFVDGLMDQMLGFTRRKRPLQEEVVLTSWHFVGRSLSLSVCVCVCDTCRDAFLCGRYPENTHVCMCMSPLECTQVDVLHGVLLCKWRGRDVSEEDIDRVKGLPPAERRQILQLLLTQQMVRWHGCTTRVVATTETSPDPSRLPPVGPSPIGGAVQSKWEEQQRVRQTWERNAQRCRQEAQATMEELGFSCMFPWPFSGCFFSSFRVGCCFWE